MGEKLVAAYDFGTSGCKLAFIDLAGKVQHVATHSYAFCTPQLGWSEQAPLEYWRAACLLMQRLLRRSGTAPDAICAISFATIWKGIIPLDKQGNVLHNNILWLDGRAHAQAQKLNAWLREELFSHKDYWPKLLWYKEHCPALYEKTQSILDVNSYLVYKATGVKSTPLSNHYTRSPDPATQKFYDAILRFCGIDSGKFPPLGDSVLQAGSVMATAAQELGLLPGTPVYGGCTDVMAISVGAGCTMAGMSHIYLGTSGWFGQVVPITAKRSYCKAASYRKNMDVIINGMNAACTAADWAIDNFYHAEHEKLGDGIYAFMDETLCGIPPGSENLIATNWLYGERPPIHPHAYAMYLNLTYRHDRRHLVNAMREAGAYTLRWRREALQAETGFTATALRAVGGGAQSDHWMQLMADVMQVPIEVMGNTRHAGAVGAASCAFVGMGVFKDFDAFGAQIKVEKMFEPRPDYMEKYNDLYGVYRYVCQSMGDIYAMLGSLQ